MARAKGKLTPKQQRFVAEYLIDLNATQAAKRAGYSQHTAKQQGSLLLTKLDIKEAIAIEAAKRAEKTEIPQAWVLERLVDNHDKAMQAVEVTDREGKGIGEFTYQGSVANRSLELLGKHLAMFTENVNVSGDLAGAGDVAKALAALLAENDSLAGLLQEEKPANPGIDISDPTQTKH